MRASEIRTQTYPREEQSLNPKIRATKLVWISLYSSPSIKQQLGRIEASAGGALAGFQGDAGMEVLRCVKSRQCLQHTETVVALISLAFKLHLIPLFSHLKLGANTPNRDHRVRFATAVFTVIFQLFVRAFYAVALSAFCQTKQATLPAIRSSPDREIHLSSYRIYLHSHICTYDCARGRFLFVLVWTVCLGSRDHAQAAVKDSADGVAGSVRAA